uniref:Uncharacterized protein n=1 Tax=Schistosoma haematobium TaxID=6185 RepID=A0A095B0Z2_SCHHA
MAFCYCSKHHSSCEEIRREQTGALGVFCANDPLWHSSILPSDRPKNTPFLDWQLAYVSLNSSDTEQKDYKGRMEPDIFPVIRLQYASLTCELYF